jgi:hypothetical protein
MKTATALALHFALDSARTAEQRASFFAFLDILSPPLQSGSAGGGIFDPEGACAGSLVELRRQLEGHWPEGAVWGGRASVEALERRWRLCGRPWADWRGGWQDCQGLWPHTRGYSCGLWTVFHAAAARAPATLPRAAGQGTGKRGSAATGSAATGSAATPARAVVEGVRGFVANFFDCPECQRHFEDICEDSVDAGRCPLETRADGMLFLWRAHNRVNRRIRAQRGESIVLDPTSTHEVWPPPALCPACRRAEAEAEAMLADAGAPPPGVVKDVGAAPDDAFDEKRVAAFLLSFYGAPARPPARGGAPAAQKRAGASGSGLPAPRPGDETEPATRRKARALRGADGSARKRASLAWSLDEAEAPTPLGPAAAAAAQRLSDEGARAATEAPATTTASATTEAPLTREDAETRGTEPMPNKASVIEEGSARVLTSDPEDPGRGSAFPATWVADEDAAGSMDRYKLG